MLVPWCEIVNRFAVTELVDGQIHLMWSASGIEFCAKGNCCLSFCSNESNPSFLARVAIFIDDVSTANKIFSVEKGVTKHHLASFTNDDRCHKYKLVKLTEEQYGDLIISDLVCDELMAMESSKQEILFIGDSITAGYGIYHKSDCDEFTTLNEDVTKSYAYLLANKLDMQAIVIANSGGGVISRWIPNNLDVKDTNNLITDIYPYKFKCSPKLIICHLGNNDSTYTKSLAHREEEFLSEYIKFINKLQILYPNSKIILLYGILETSLIHIVEKVSKCCDVHFIKIPKLKDDEIHGFAGHPNISEHINLSNYIFDELRRRNILNY